jgi:hypothetical protein
VSGSEDGEDGETFGLLDDVRRDLLGHPFRRLPLIRFVRVL